MTTVDRVLSEIVEPVVTRRRSSNEWQAVTVLDDFSAHSFSGALNLWPVQPHQFRFDIPLINPDFLLVESAWQGNSGKWRYMVTSPEGPKPALVELVDYCKSLGIPTVFWNKEDPPHFEEFLPTARLFDYVLTTDADMIPRYKKETSAKDVRLLRFAANPQLHEPRRVDGFRSGDIAFAGQYFAHKFPERREQMKLLFSEAQRYNFSIYSRALGGDPRYQFPARFAPNVVGSLPYGEMVKAYRKHKIFLNVNSVVNSSSMCARRVYELSASKTAVVGTSSAAIRSVFPSDEISLGKDRPEVRRIFSELLADEGAEVERRSYVQRAWRRTLSNHTYAHRVREIAEMVGLSSIQSSLRLELYVSALTDSLVEELRRQSFTLDRNVEVVLIDRATQTPIYVSNAQIHSSSTPGEIRTYYGVLDAKYSYGRFYLNDLVLALEQSEERFVAKCDPGQINSEESVVSGLPPHGWLGRDQDVCLAEPEEANASLINKPVYLSDPCGFMLRGGGNFNPLFDV